MRGGFDPQQLRDPFGRWIRIGQILDLPGGGSAKVLRADHRSGRVQIELPGGRTETRHISELTGGRAAQIPSPGSEGSPLDPGDVVEQPRAPGGKGAFRTANPNPSLHTFESSGEAYDRSQTDDSIRDGDILHVPTEGVTGVLVGAWPVAVSDEAGSFHRLAPGTTPDDIDGMNYNANFKKATEIHLGLNQPAEDVTTVRSDELGDVPAEEYVKGLSDNDLRDTISQGGADAPAASNEADARGINPLIHDKPGPSPSPTPTPAGPGESEMEHIADSAPVSYGGTGEDPDVPAKPLKQMTDDELENAWLDGTVERSQVESEMASRGIEPPEDLPDKVEDVSDPRYALEETIYNDLADLQGEVDEQRPGTSQTIELDNGVSVTYRTSPHEGNAPQFTIESASAHAETRNTEDIDEASIFAADAIEQAQADEPVGTEGTSRSTVTPTAADLDAADTGWDDLLEDEEDLPPQTPEEFAESLNHLTPAQIVAEYEDGRIPESDWQAVRDYHGIAKPSDPDYQEYLNETGQTDAEFRGRVNAAYRERYGDNVPYAGVADFTTPGSSSRGEEESEMAERDNLAWAVKSDPKMLSDDEVSRAMDLPDSEASQAAEEEYWRRLDAGEIDPDDPLFEGMGAPATAAAGGEPGRKVEAKLPKDESEGQADTVSSYHEPVGIESVPVQDFFNGQTDTLEFEGASIERSGGDFDIETADGQFWTLGGNESQDKVLDVALGADPQDLGLRRDELDVYHSPENAGDAVVDDQAAPERSLTEIIDALYDAQMGEELHELGALEVYPDGDAIVIADDEGGPHEEYIEKANVIRDYLTEEMGVSAEIRIEGEDDDPDSPVQPSSDDLLKRAQAQPVSVLLPKDSPFAEESGIPTIADVQSIDEEAGTAQVRLHLDDEHPAVRDTVADNPDMPVDQMEFIDTVPLDAIQVNNEPLLGDEPLVPGKGSPVDSEHSAYDPEADRKAEEIAVAPDDVSHDPPTDTFPDMPEATAAAGDEPEPNALDKPKQGEPGHPEGPGGEMTIPDGVDPETWEIYGGDVPDFEGDRQYFDPRRKVDYYEDGIQNLGSLGEMVPGDAYEFYPPAEDERDWPSTSVILEAEAGPDDRTEYVVRDAEGRELPDEMSGGFNGGRFGSQEDAINAIYEWFPEDQQGVDSKDPGTEGGPPHLSVSGQTMPPPESSRDQVLADFGAAHPKFPGDEGIGDIVTYQGKTYEIARGGPESGWDLNPPGNWGNLSGLVRKVPDSEITVVLPHEDRVPMVWDPEERRYVDPPDAAPEAPSAEAPSQISPETLAHMSSAELEVIANAGGPNAAAAQAALAKRQAVDYAGLNRMSSDDLRKIAMSDSPEASAAAAILEQRALDRQPGGGGGKAGGSTGPSEPQYKPEGDPGQPSWGSRVHDDHSGRRFSGEAGIRPGVEPSSEENLGLFAVTARSGQLADPVVGDASQPGAQGEQPGGDKVKHLEHLIRLARTKDEKEECVKMAAELGCEDRIPEKWSDADVDRSLLNFSDYWYLNHLLDQRDQDEAETFANWVEKAGGLPKYIKRIAKHLREKGKSESHAIAIAVNAVKKMCATGDVNFPGAQQVNAGSKAEACEAVAEWEAKKAKAHATSQDRSADTVTFSADAGGDTFAATPMFEMLRADTYVKGGREIQITPDDLQEAVKNFERDRQDGYRIPIDYDHSFAEGRGSLAAGWIEKLQADGDRLLCSVDWTDKAREGIGRREWRYISAEFSRDHETETGEERGFAILGGGLTNRPFLRTLGEVPAS